MAGTVPGRSEMKTFHYKVVCMYCGGRDKLDIEIELDAWGREGWELCAVEYGCWIFKREREE